MRANDEHIPAAGAHVVQREETEMCGDTMSDEWPDEATETRQIRVAAHTTSRMSAQGVPCRLRE